jgi:hypothetical protein
MVNCTEALDAPSAAPIWGMEARYMSVESGPSPTIMASRIVMPRVPGFNRMGFSGEDLRTLML